MFIYQLHEFGGECDDAFDRIVSSFTSIERAEKEKREKEREEAARKAMAKKCDECPIHTYMKNVNQLARQCREYCDSFRGYTYNVEGWKELDCKNLYLHYENKSYRIERIKVQDDGFLAGFKGAYDKPALRDWYMSSANNKPIWTEEHINELFKDFILIPKNSRRDRK